MAKKPWEGRFSEPTDEMVEAFSSSIHVDRRLYAQDIAGSVAHARTLNKAGVLSDEELKSLEAALSRVKKEIEEGNKFTWDPALEDIHMHVEERLRGMVGDLAGKLHTGRSRNDQVATDFRLYLKQEAGEVIRLLRRVRGALLDLAAAHMDCIMPGYTHLQRAQPVLAAHHFLAYYEMFFRDTRRFAQCLDRMDEMPLGSAALAGTTFALDREYTARELGFSRVCRNSMDAVADRDFCLEFASAASIAMIHLSRLCEEIVLWSSQEFGFLTLPDAFATGSSIMPQKKNPDVAELVRGKTGRVLGAMTALFTLLKSLPLAYNRDLQEDKEPMFDCADTVKACLAVMARMLPHLAMDRERCADAARKGFLDATDLADYLAAKGLPFRDAHHVAGRAVALAQEKGVELTGLSLAELQGLSDLVEKDVFGFLSLEAMVNRRATLGGTATGRVKEALAQARAELAAEGEGRA
ncbi:MAG: argininosuccinate lyase [Deltaproteobacteria bacterium]|nr:argininosuccinate lyase [Deltaproteobacteria bacterium]